MNQAIEFAEKLAGQWDNKNQAFRNPSLFAHVIVGIRPIFINYANDILMFQEQAYSYQVNTPYRVRCLLLMNTPRGDIEIANYKLVNPEKYYGGSRDPDKLTKLTPLFDPIGKISLMEGCNMVVKKIDEEYQGKVPNGSCVVYKRGKPTCLHSELLLSGSELRTLDQGRDPVSGELIWGSSNGEFVFDKVEDFRTNLAIK